MKYIKTPLTPILTPTPGGNWSFLLLSTVFQHYGSASADLDANPQELYMLNEVKQLLNSVTYIAPA